MSLFAVSGGRFSEFGPIRYAEETPVVRYPLSAPWHPEGGEQYAAGFWLPYIASEEDARQHVADFDRTRIMPGANPRSKCEPFDWQTMRHLLARRPHAIAEVAVFDADGRVVGLRCIVMDHPLARVRIVVPEDVARWRDPEHRAELKRRARAYATDRVTYAWPAQSTADAGQRVNAQSTSDLEREG